MEKRSGIKQVLLSLVILAVSISMLHAQPMTHKAFLEDLREMEGELADTTIEGGEFILSEFSSSINDLNIRINDAYITKLYEAGHWNHATFDFESVYYQYPMNEFADLLKDFPVDSSGIVKNQDPPFYQTPTVVFDQKLNAVRLNKPYDGNMFILVLIINKDNFLPGLKEKDLVDVVFRPHSVRKFEFSYQINGELISVEAD